MLTSAHMTFTPDLENGGISAIRLAGDSAAMNFVKQGRRMLVPVYTGRDTYSDFSYLGSEAMAEGLRMRFENRHLTVTVTVAPRPSGDMEASLLFENKTDKEEYFFPCDYAVTLPVNDCYPDSETCIRERAHAHIFCGESASYVNCLRMGNNSYNLGILTERGGFVKYSQEEVKTNDRGVFLLHPELRRLSPRGTYAITLRFFRHEGASDFRRILGEAPSQLLITAERYTLFWGEPIRFAVSRPCTVLLGNETVGEGVTSVTYLPKHTGPHRFTLLYGDGERTHAEFYVSEPLETVLEKRCGFLVKHQQCLEPESKLYGAFLPYDNTEKTLFYDALWRDHNAGRERLGMGILLCNYAILHKEERFLHPLALYADFLLRSIVDEESGEVFDREGREGPSARLYNNGWVARFFTDYFRLTWDRRYLALSYRILRSYYEKGGEGFYPNSSFGHCIAEIRRAGEKAWTEELLAHLEAQMKTFIQNGTDYPAHEVHYEQTIVSPAVTLLLDAYDLTGKPEYLENAKAHFVILRRFNGEQPEYHLNGIAIRFWDDYWFGKSKCFGDTFPHYWSVLSGTNALRLGLLLGDERLIADGENTIRNNLNLFFPDGSASCAYVYPHRVNGVPGGFYDELANDQDFALVNALDWFINKHPV